jgi:hypothetical protein
MSNFSLSVHAGEQAMHWRELNRCAVLETNPVLFKQKVLQAELAVSSRLSELLNIPNSSAGDEEEKRDLRTTLDALKTLQREDKIRRFYNPPKVKRIGG